ncbi:putative exonuclease GOR isoform X2 [Diabrotica undecimpunctata]
MDFSSNGKYLTSCDDEDPDPGGKEATTARESNKENDQPPESNPSPKGLSRRQRKNRRREDRSPSESQKVKKAKSKKPPEATSVLTKKQVMSVIPLKQFQKFNASEKMYSHLLRNYMLTMEQMISMGYPIQSALDPSLVVVYKTQRVPMKPIQYTNSTVFNLNAREFVPKNDWSSNDSGQGSGSSSDSGENFDGDESTTSSSDQDTSIFSQEIPRMEPLPISLQGQIFAKSCARCSRTFYTTDKEYITKEKCCYHWGKLQNTSSDKKSPILYTCCQRRGGSKGCTEAERHVWGGFYVGVNGLYNDYVYTKHRKSFPLEGHHGVYAIDCEMCYTINGLELTKVTVVGMDGRLVYDSFVKPESVIIDYNTRFSGITEKDMNRSTTKSLKEVQNDLMGFISANTILIGHGLENDLHALKIVHYVVVDTVQCFPHFHGLPFRRSLKELTFTFLRRDIQNSPHGHNSYEDAAACMELMLWRVRKDYNRRHIHIQY